MVRTVTIASYHTAVGPQETYATVCLVWQGVACRVFVFSLMGPRFIASSAAFAHRPLSSLQSIARSPLAGI